MHFKLSSGFSYLFSFNFVSGMHCVPSKGAGTGIIVMSVERSHSLPQSCLSEPNGSVISKPTKTCSEGKAGTLSTIVICSTVYIDACDRARMKIVPCGLSVCNLWLNFPVFVAGGAIASAPFLRIRVNNHAQETIHHHSNSTTL